MRYIAILLAIPLAIGLFSCAKPRAQGSFKATECKSVCENNTCQTRCISADGRFK